MTTQFYISHLLIHRTNQNNPPNTQNKPLKILNKWHSVSKILCKPKDALRNEIQIVISLHKN